MLKRKQGTHLNPLFYPVGFCAVFCVLWLLITLIHTLLPLLQVGLPLLLGCWIWQHHRSRWERQQDRLNRVFYQLLQEHQGCITVLNFAMHTQLSAIAAKRFLDTQAKEFSAQFGVTEAGEVVYLFPMVRSPLEQPSNQPTPTQKPRFMRINP